MPTTTKSKSPAAVSQSDTAAANQSFPSPSTSSSSPPDFMAETMRLAEFAKRYKISLPTAYDWLDPNSPNNAAGGPLPSMKIGRERLVHVPTADAWVRARLTGQPSKDVA
ncbi:MAG: hypothetical protein ABWZ57_07170 [Mesorhizobium sp.]